MVREWVDSVEEQRLLLNLTTVSGVGAVRMRALMSKFEKPSAIAGAGVRDLVAVDGIDRQIAAAVRKCGAAPFGDAQLQALFERECRLLTYWDPLYPTLLKHIDDPPLVLYIWGDFAPADAFSLAIVGTRMPTRYGRQVTEKLVAELVQYSVTIVSGLARGIDTVAHAEAVKKGGRTIAVLGSGLDVIYPRENLTLAKEIVKNGAVITEQPFGTQPDAVNFPKRNRIISGLSLGTIVVEAREKSGALITANLSLDQNREVFAIPGSIFSPQSRGCHELIKTGAKLVGSVNDILDELPQQGELFRREEFVATLPADLSPAEKRTLGKLSREPVHIDALARTLNEASGALLAVLLQLEFQGLVQQLPGMMFVRS